MEGARISVGTGLSLLGLVRKAMRKVQGKPTEAESATVEALVRKLDERRVFSAPYNSEVAEVCVYSLREVKKATDEVLASIEHEGLRASVGGILDAVRAFLDCWPNPKDIQTGGHGRRMRWSGEPGDSEAEFFKDLGTLRAVVVSMIECAAVHAPKVRAPTLLPK